MGSTTTTPAIAGTITNAEALVQQQNMQSVIDATNKAIASNQFVFVATFDGTNNDNKRGQSY
jgi:hypothetical protein